MEDGTGMLCSLCRKHSRRPQKSVVGKAVWTDTPCRSITRPMIGLLKCMYFLNKRELAHTTNFVPLGELGKSLGALYLQDLQ